MHKELYSINEVASLLGLHVKTVRNHVREGRLGSTRVGRQYRITRVDLEVFTGGALGNAALQGPVETEVSSVVEINGLDADKARRLASLIGKAIKGRKEESQVLKVETLYDEVRARLRVIILGSLKTTSALLGMIEHLSHNNRTA